METKGIKQLKVKVGKKLNVMLLQHYKLKIQILIISSNNKIYYNRKIFQAKKKIICNQVKAAII